MVDALKEIPTQRYGKTEFDHLYAEATQETLIGLYSNRGKDGQPLETVTDIVWRVAIANAMAELRYTLTPDALVNLTIEDALTFTEVTAWASTIADAIGNQKFWANTPCNINADPEVALKVLQYEAHGLLAGMSIDEIWLDTADHVAFYNFMHPGPVPKSAHKHKHHMGRIATEIRGLGTLAACGVTYVDDTLDSILKAARDMTIAAKASQGMGINTSNLRPWSTHVANGAAASGPERFYAKTIASAVEAVAQGGRRGGALIELRNSDHPDILFFIDKKKLLPVPVFATILKEQLTAYIDKSVALEKAAKIYAERHHAYVDRQNYLKNTNVTVLAMPGFMEAVENKQWYQTHWNGKPWAGPIYDPRKPKLDPKTGQQMVNKLTKELLFEEYENDHRILGTYPRGYLYAPDVFERLCEGMRDSGEPGIMFYEHVNNANANPHHYDLNTCNPCFDGETFVLTKQGHFKISALVGKCVDVWNGKEWVEVDNFRVTGVDQEMLKVTLSSGQSLRVTPYHKFILSDGTRVEAKDLSTGQYLLRHDFQIHGKHEEKAAYLKGFLIGDGEAQDGGNRPGLWLYSTKFMCEQRLLESAAELPITNRTTNTVQELGSIGFEYDRNAAHPALNQPEYKRKQIQGLTARRDQLLPWVSNFKTSLPISDMLNWSLESKCQFVAGLMDADGSAADTKNGFMYQIWSVSHKMLLDLQQLLLSMGVESKCSIGKKAELKDFGVDHGGVCQTQDTWRLIISQRDSIALASLVYFSRLTSFADRTVRNHLKQSRWAKIFSVEKDGTAAQVYCCTEDLNHAFSLSQGIVSAQCGEQCLPAGPSKDGQRNFMGVCNLSSLHAAHSTFWHDDGGFNYEAMKEVVLLQQRFMDNSVDISYFPMAEQNLTARLERRTGGGFAGIAEHLSRLGVRFGSKKSNRMVYELFRAYCNASLQASKDLAKERGMYPLWEGSKYEAEKIAVRNTCMVNNAPTGTLAQAMQTTWGVDPHNGIVFSRKVRSRYVDFVAPGFKEMMQKFNAWPGEESEQQILMAQIRANNKSVKGLTNVPIEVQNAYPIRLEITPMEYIDHLGACFKAAETLPYLFNSISNTCSIPMDSPLEDIKAAIIHAHSIGVKDLTFYPDGSRTSAPIEVISSAVAITHDALSLLNNSAPAQSDVDTSITSGTSYKVRVGMPDGPATLHVMLNHAEGKPDELLEVYAHIGKSGTSESGLLEAIGRLCSTFLQYSAKFGSAEREIVEKIILKQLIGINDGYAAYHRFPNEGKPKLMTSICDALAKTIKYHRSRKFVAMGVQPLIAAIEDGTIKSLNKPVNPKLVCKECGSECTHIDGCVVCLECGSSRCQ